LGRRAVELEEPNSVGQEQRQSDDPGRSVSAIGHCDGIRRLLPSHRTSETPTPLRPFIWPNSSCFFSACPVLFGGPLPLQESGLGWTWIILGSFASLPDVPLVCCYGRSTTSRLRGESQSSTARTSRLAQASGTNLDAYARTRCRQNLGFMVGVDDAAASLQRIRHEQARCRLRHTCVSLMCFSGSTCWCPRPHHPQASNLLASLLLRLRCRTSSPASPN